MLGKIGTCCLLLGAICWGQTSACPITLTINGAEGDATNVSTKTIVFVAIHEWVSASGPRPNLAMHDFYFQPGGQPPGATFEVQHPSQDPGQNITKLEPVYVKFADGTTWGDSTAIPAYQMADLNQGRSNGKEFYQGAISAYNQGGDTGLANYLTTASQTPHDAPTEQAVPNMRNLGKKYLKIQQTSGSTAAISEIQSHLDAAKGRNF